MLSRLLFAAGLLALAAPASAAADTTLTAGPVKARGYQLTLLATDGAKDSLTVMATRRSGGSTQTHMWSFASGVTVKAGGEKPSISAKLGRYGNLKLTLGGIRSGGRGTVPAGCSGTVGTLDRGTFAGKLQLTLDRSFFKTVKAGRAPGTRIGGGTLRCDGQGPGRREGVTLMANAQQADGGSFTFSAARDAAGRVTQQATVSEAAAKAAPATSALHMITAAAPASGFTVADDLSTARVAAVAPFLAGELAFQGESTGTMATGAFTGSLVARFDSIGDQTLPADASAMVMRG